MGNALQQAIAAIQRLRELLASTQSLRNAYSGELVPQKQPPLISPVDASWLQPINTPPQQPSVPRILDVAKYQGASKTPVALPSQYIQDLLWQHSPNDATRSAVALAGENKGFDTHAINVNTDGSTDYGLMQTNNRTINEMLTKQPFSGELRQAGINRPTDVLGSAEKSVIANQVARNYESAPRWTGDTRGAPAWGRWYGWQNNGYNMFPEQSIQDVAKNPAYFKLAEFLNRN